MGRVDIFSMLGCRVRAARRCREIVGTQGVSTLAFDVLSMAARRAVECSVSDVLGAEVRWMLDTRALVRSMPEAHSAAALADWRDEHGIRKPDDDIHALTGYTGPYGDPWA